MNYDPNLDPDPTEWLEMTEGERISSIERHHRKAGIRLGNSTAHAGIDAAVETQLAEGLPSVRRTLQRLLGAGMQRPEIIHAVGAVLAEEIFHIMKEGRAFDNDGYAKRLRDISA